jgi:hypothetical protein
MSYVMQFKGAARPKPGANGVLLTESTSGTDAIITSIGDHGVDAEIRSGSGIARFSSEARLTPDGGVIEDGTIRFGEVGSLTFSTRGVGAIGPSRNPKRRHGAICWDVNGGTGVFEGATGIITSNFLVSDNGEVEDNHWGVIFLP